MLITSSSYT